MANEIISSFESFESNFPEMVKRHGKGGIAEAFRRYFSKGGVISIAEKRENDWPKLSYPSRSRINSQIKELEEMRSSLQKQHGSWKKKQNSAKSYEITQHFKKLSEPLYWKHLLKAATSKDYKNDAEAVKLPAHLVSDKRWKPMVNMFVNNIDYRKQLTETVQHSVVYKKHRKLAKYSDDLQNFRIEVSKKKLGSLKEKLSEIDADIRMFKTLQGLSIR
ncbi:MAG: hypothetical protein HYW05_04350 [Candidatus Diapherotrites archaeon]|nr:hypothetical protein [Candidatus Diapherotrites archaeon]